MGKRSTDTDTEQFELGKLQGRYMSADISEQEAKDQLDNIVPMGSGGFVSRLFE